MVTDLVYHCVIMRQYDTCGSVFEKESSSGRKGINQSRVLNVEYVALKDVGDLQHTVNYLDEYKFTIKH